jgi:hypothetical protein
MGTCDISDAPSAKIYTGKYPIRCSTYLYARGISQIVDGGHDRLLSSSIPKELDGALWVVLRRCWAVNHLDRPTMTEVENELRELRQALGACKA